MNSVPKLYSKVEIERMLYDAEHSRNLDLRDIAEDFKNRQENIQRTYLKRLADINRLPRLLPIFDEVEAPKPLSHD